MNLLRKSRALCRLHARQRAARLQELGRAGEFGYRKGQDVMRQQMSEPRRIDGCIWMPAAAGAGTLDTWEFRAGCRIVRLRRRPYHLNVRTRAPEFPGDDDGLLKFGWFGWEEA